MLESNKKTEKLHISVSPQDKESIMKLAKQCGMTVSELVRVAIRTYAEEQDYEEV